MGKFFLCFCISMMVYLVKLQSGLHQNNTIYGLEHINWYDNNLFHNHYAVHESWRTVRLMMDVVISGGMYFFNGSWENSVYFMILLSMCILAFATVRIAEIIAPRHKIFFSWLLSIFFACNVNAGFPGFNIYELPSIGLGGGVALAILAISYALNNKWNIAYLLLAITVLIHIHEGVWGGLCVALLRIYEICRKKSENSNVITLISPAEKLGALLYILSLIVVTVIGVSGDINSLPSKEFTYIYANIRHPHHLVNSAWGIGTTLKFFFLPFLAMHLYRFIIVKEKMLNRTRILNIRFALALAMISWLLLYITNYIFIELVPNATVATMFIPKFFKYIGILSVIWSMKTLSVLIDRERYLIFIFSLITIWFASIIEWKGTILSYVILMFVIRLYYGWKLANAYKKLWFKMAVVSLSMIELIISSRREVVLIVATGICILLFQYRHRFASYMNGKKAVLLGLFILFLGFGKQLIYVNNDGLQVYTPERHLVSSMGDDFYNMANLAKAKLPSDAVIFADPNDERSAWFQLVARRNVYVVEHVIPSSKNQVLEWYKRMRASSNIMASEDDAFIYKFLADNNIRYILVNEKLQNKFLDDGRFNLILVSKDNKYRIYELQ